MVELGRYVFCRRPRAHGVLLEGQQWLRRLVERGLVVYDPAWKYYRVSEAVLRP